MRLFIAIELPEDIKNYLRQIQQQLPEVRMSKAKDFHLTLKFLGEIDETMAENIKRELEKISFEKFSLTLSDIGVFPNERNVRVVWTGLKECKELIKLQKAVEAALRSFGFKSDKRFHPHLTLARIKHVDDKKLFMEKLKTIKTQGKTFPVKSFCLFRSILTPECPVYEVLGEY